ncbi:MAG: MBG domain-containing protein, partial [Verrucomicrobiota bacterium]
GSYAVAATINDPNYHDTAAGTLIIDKAAATIGLTGLTQTYDGSPKSVTASTTPIDLTVAVTYNGFATAPSAAGSYALAASVTDPDHTGSAADTLTIKMAPAVIDLTGLTQTYDGAPKPVTAGTTPTGLSVDLAYNGSTTVPSAAGSYAIVATVNDPNHTGATSGTLTIEKATVTPVLVGLTQTYDGSPKPITATTTPAGLAVAITYDGAAIAPSAAGSYALAATITDPNHAGSAAGTLVIQKATATIALTNLTQTYDGSPKPVTATTTPLGLAVDITYSGSTTSPSAVGSYALEAAVHDANHTGSATATLIIEKATATLAFSGLTQTYDGLPKTVTATSTPAGLTVDITYAGTPAAPSAVGSYAILATVNDANYTGTTPAALTIQKAAATIALAGLTQTYDGTPKTVTTTTTPAGLNVDVTYDGSPTAPTLAGSYAVSAAINEPNFQATATNSLVIVPAKEWTLWRDEYFTAAEQAAGLADPAADPDGDGLTNLAEYALGTNPRQATPHFVASRNSNGLSLVFTRPANLPDVIYSAEASDNLGTWSPVVLEVIAQGAIETVRARDPLLSGNLSRRFLRLCFESR